MSRSVKIYIEDMLKAIEKIELYTNNISYEIFKDDSMRYDAVVRRFEILGEAATQIKKADSNFYEKYPQIEWNKVKNFRNILIHCYFGVIEKIVWDTIKINIPELKQNLNLIYKELKCE